MRILADASVRELYVNDDGTFNLGDANSGLMTSEEALSNLWSTTEPWAERKTNNPYVRVEDITDLHSLSEDDLIDAVDESVQIFDHLTPRERRRLGYLEEAALDETDWYRWFADPVTHEAQYDFEDDADLEAPLTKAEEVQEQFGSDLVVPKRHSVRQLPQSWKDQKHVKRQWQRHAHRLDQPRDGDRLKTDAELFWLDFAENVSVHREWTYDSESDQMVERLAAK